MSKITPYQWQLPLIDSAVASMQKDRLFISGFPTGSGKTVISLSAAKIIGGPHLVIAPKVALTQWRRMAEALDMAEQIIGVVNPERISSPRGCEFYTRDRKWILPPNTTVIWDEPHRGASGIKSHTAVALAELKAFAPRLHAMSATLADTPLKLRALGWWAGLHNFNDSSFYDWCRKHGCSNVDIGWGRGAAGRSVFKFTTSAVKARQHMLDIRREFGTRFMSLKPCDIPDFPTQTLAVKLVDLDKRGREEVDSAYAEMSDRMKKTATSDMAELGRERERIEFVMAEPLAEIVAAHVEDGMSAVVFWNFTEPRLRFEAALNTLGISEITSVYGGQSDDVRQAGIDRFQDNKVHVASVMTKAGGASLSLHDVKKERPRVSYMCPAYEADLIKQCLGRIRRCEGTHAAQYFVIAARTIQEKVAKSMERKLGNIDTLNDGDLLP